MKSRPSAAEVIERGQKVFETRVAAQVADANPHDFLAIDILSGAFAVDADDMTAENKVLARAPDAVLYLRRVGDEVAHTVGGAA